MKHFSSIFKSLLLLSSLLPSTAFAQVYELVTSAEQLKAGEQYLIVNAEYQKAISSAHKDAKNLPSTSVDIQGGIIREIGIAQVFTLEFRSSGYSFKCDKGYLQATSNSNNELTYYVATTPNSNSKATITINEDYTATIVFDAPNTTKNTIQYNSESDLFSCYASGQQPVSIFRYTMGDPSKLYQTLHFSSYSATVDIGDSFQEPILSGAETNVTYTSSNIDVASVNATTGKVTIKDIGTTKITATAEATEEYNMGSTSYTLTVKPLEEFYDFTNPEALGFTFPNTASREIIIDKDIIMGTVTMSVTHGSNTETRFYKNTNNEIYLGVYLGGSIAFCVPDSYTIDKISFSPKKGENLEGLPGITNNEWKAIEQQSSITFEVTKNVLLLSAKVYYKKLTPPTITQDVSISSVGYSTFSSTSPMIIPSGIKAGIVEINDAIATVHYIYKEGDIIPANEGVLLNGSQGIYEFESSNLDAEKPTTYTNHLRPASTNDTIKALNQEKFYILANDKNDGLGFYYQGIDGDGSKVWNLQGKAYLVSESTTAVKGFRLDGNSLTIIETIPTASTQPLNIFTLSGTRLMNVDVKDLPQGFYVINGKKHFVK